MDFDSLLQILNGKFYMACKEAFNDHFDAVKYFPVNARWGYTPFGEKTSKEKYEQNEKRINKIEETAKWLTSCWTENRNNILMWQTYTKGYCGVCIESTICDFIKSIKHNNYNILCGKVDYGCYSPSMRTKEYAFNELPQYKDEKEIRFYFLNNKDQYTNEQKKIHRLSYNVFDIEPEKMIDSIILSPFIRSANSADMLKDLLENRFNFLKGKIKTNIIKYI